MAVTYNVVGVVGVQVDVANDIGVTVVRDADSHILHGHGVDGRSAGHGVRDLGPG
mgnify:CR=1 FL=1